MNDHTVPAFETSLVQRYFRDLWLILTNPTAFFRRMPATGGLSGPLAFALVTHWLASAAEFLWRALFGGAALKYFQEMMNKIPEIDGSARGAMWAQLQDGMMNWFWGAGAVMIDPFLTLSSIFFTAGLMFVAARLFVREREVTFESAARIVCYGISPSILAVIPFFGTPISWIWTLVVTVIGTREVYRIPTVRAAVVALFPKLFIPGIITLGVLVAIFAVFGAFLS